MDLNRPTRSHQERTRAGGPPPQLLRRAGQPHAYESCTVCHPGGDRYGVAAARVLDAMRAWQSRYGRLPSSYDWSRTHARRRGGQSARAARGWGVGRGKRGRRHVRQLGGCARRRAHVGMSASAAAPPAACRLLRRRSLRGRPLPVPVAVNCRDRRRRGQVGVAMSELFLHLARYVPGEDPRPGCLGHAEPGACRFRI
jgi:hypothetical protein